MTVLQMSLGKRRIVIPAQHHIVEGIALDQLQQALIGNIVLLPASQPILQVLLRYQAFKKQGFLLFPLGEAFGLFLVLQARIPEDISSIMPVVSRLLMA